MADNEKAPATERKTNTGGDVDRVQMASRHPDGSPHQTPGFEVIDQDFYEEATREQLKQQAVSAVDFKLRSEAAAPEEDDGKHDEQTQRLIDATASAAKSAEARAVR